MNQPSPHIRAIIFDFSRVILFPKDPGYQSGLNALHRSLHATDPDYEFLGHFRINTELLDMLRQIKLPMYVFTTGFVQEHRAVRSALQSVFKAVYSAEQLGVSKSEPATYRALCNKIGVAPEHALFVDDTAKNVEAARKAKLQAYRYTDNERLEQFFRKLKLT
jgi:HAD superfamily hydrolase (TIGR01509 family)